MNTVTVSGRQDGDDGGPLWRKSCAIAYAGAGGNATQTDDARPQTHHWLQRQAALRLLALFRRIVAGMIAVENHAGAHHVSPAFRARGNGGAVGHVHDAGIDAEFAEVAKRGVKVFFLIQSLLALR